jgi:hypothetical protein
VISSDVWGGCPTERSTSSSTGPLKGLITPSEGLGLLVSADDKEAYHFSGSGKNVAAGKLPSCLTLKASAC